MARRCSSDKHSTGLISSELRATGHLSDRLISAVAAVSSVSYSALERSEISCYVQPRIRRSDSDTLRCSDSSCSVLVHMQTVRAMLMRKYRGIRSCYRCCREPVDPPKHAAAMYHNASMRTSQTSTTLTHAPGAHPASQLRLQTDPRFRASQRPKRWRRHHRCRLPRHPFRPISVRARE